MTIGGLAVATATDAQTIRYYERLELLPKPRRTESNYRTYDDTYIQRIMFIKRAKEIGFSLNDIKVLLSMADGKVVGCKEVRRFAETRLSKIRAQIVNLNAMERALSELLRQCALSEKITDCPILESLSEGN